jgi:putative oxidoreductase
MLQIGWQTGELDMDEFCAKWQPQFLSVLRIMTGLLFLEHGTSKYLGFPHVEKVPEALSMPGISGMFELVGGALIVLGLFTRPVAFLLSGNMAVAYFYAHAPRAFFPVLNGGDPAILYCFVFLYLFFAGAGPWSVDAMMKGK